jgi:hypothetical protein
MKTIRFASALLVLLVLAGCRSHVVQVTLTNTSQQPISTIVVDYPQATFGVNTLIPGQTFSYSIKPLETGALKVQFTNAQGVKHSSFWPMLHKGDEGSIQVKFTQDSAMAEPALK